MTRQIEPFHAMAIGRLAHHLASEGRSIIHMEYGQPSTGAPAAAIAEAHRILDADALGYWESAPLKARIARHYAETQGVTIRPERVILTCGASPAVFTTRTRSASSASGSLSPGRTSSSTPLSARPAAAGCSSP